MDIEEQYNKIYRYCYMKTRDHHTSEDLTQETFLHFLENHSYREIGKQMATLFSAKAALMARVLIIGLVQIGILLFTIPTACVRVDITFFQAAFYILCPYCLSACLNLGVLCRLHGENAEYVCIAVSSILYYITIIMLILDPVYLCLLSGCFGGGDLNGILYLMPQAYVWTIFGLLLIFNIWLLIKRVTPTYTKAFQSEEAN